MTGFLGTYGRLAAMLLALLFSLGTRAHGDDTAANPSVEVQTGHRTVVNLVFSPDGKLMASGGGSDAIKVWEIATGQMRFDLPYSGGVGPFAERSLIFTPDSQTLIVAGNTISFWDATTGLLKRTVPLQLSPNSQGGYAGVVHSALSPDGSLLACGMRDRQVLLYDLANGNLLRTLRGSPGFINSLSFSADGKKVLEGSAPRCWCAWDAATGQQVGGQFVTAAGNGNAVGYPSAFDPSGDSFVCANVDGQLRRWDTHSGKEFGAYPERIATIAHVAFSADNSKLAGVGATVHVWEARTGRLLFTLPTEHGSRDVVAFNATNDQIAVGNDYTIELWDMASHQKLRTFGVKNPPVEAVAFRPDGQCFAIAAENGVIVHEASTGRRIYTVRDDRQVGNEASLRRVLCTAFSPDSRLLAVGGVSIGAEMTLIVDASSGRRLHTLQLTRDYEPGTRDYSFEYGSPNPAYRVTVGALAFSPDGSLLATASVLAAQPRDFGPVAITLWNVSTGRRVRSITIPTVRPRNGFVAAVNEIHSVSFTPDGSSLFAAGHLFAVADGTDEGVVPGAAESRSFTGTPTIDTAGLYERSPDGARLFLKNHVVSAQTKQQTPPLSEDQISAFTFSRDSHTFAFADSPQQSALQGDAPLNRGRIGLVGAESSEARFLTGHAGRVTSLAFSPDGKFLLSAGSDGTARFWDVRTAREILRLYLLGDDDYVVLAPDGYYVATRNAVRYINLREKSGAVPIGQFDLRLNRPDIILQRLGYASDGLINAYHTAWLKRLAKQNFTPEMLASDIHVPEVRLNYRLLPVATRDSAITITVHAQDTLFRLNRLRVLVNDVPLGLGAGIDLRARKAKEVDLPVNIRLSAGRNRVQVSVMNEKGGESFYQVFEVYRNVPQPKPDLYVLTIGVSRYKDAARSLSFAAKDAADVATFFKAQDVALLPLPEKGKGHRKPSSGATQTRSEQGSPDCRYQRVQTRTLVNADVTLKNILAARAFLAKAREDDVVVVFIAGHGLLDSEYNYFFGTYDVEFNDPSKNGLSYAGLEDLLDGISARRKLLLMDTCFAGETDRYVSAAEQTTISKASLPPVNKAATAPASPDASATAPMVKRTGEIDGNLPRGVVEIDLPPTAESSAGLPGAFTLMQDLFTDLNRGNGAAVITAAGGAQYAFEREGQGVFTASVLQGLRTREADANHDGRISVSELRDYVASKVNERTGGRQVPTARRESLEFDFDIL